MSHVPWLGAILLSYPESFADYRKLRMYGQERAMRRIKEGSRSKDLFYHLVRYIFNLLVMTFRVILMHNRID